MSSRVEQSYLHSSGSPSRHPSHLPCCIHMHSRFIRSIYRITLQYSVDLPALSVSGIHKTSGLIPPTDDWTYQKPPYLLGIQQWRGPDIISRSDHSQRNCIFVGSCTAGEYHAIAILRGLRPTQLFRVERVIPAATNLYRPLARILLLVTVVFKLSP